ncbi:hypothetical protein GOP47_0006210 [Adiantum capillus-veneris]|uniref:Uncharacterized protein n=1 Tax=Adiantum capillus-veneris TaxID=13818 RepID=A0A9D4V2G5_ADICA|nr:hypothetical protein GOP47_0006210 [Adiantum capillus-veneris]
MADAVQRLRYALEAYERRSPHDHHLPTSSAGLDLCSNVLSLSAHIWPSIIPDTLLVKLWMSVKDETLKQLHLYGRETWHIARSGEELDNRLLQTINTFLSQCPDLPFDLFWEECTSIILQLTAHEDSSIALHATCCAHQLFLGLLHMMEVHCTSKSLFTKSKYDEDSLVRLYVLLRLTLDQSEENNNLLATTLLFKWNSSKSVRFGFQMILNLFQSEAVPKLNILQPAWALLEDLRQADEEEWSGCLSALLYRILKIYLEKGPTCLEELPTKALLGLFSSKAFARTFLDCITVYPDLHKSVAGALSAAFQIFELVFAKHPEIITACCLTKAVDEKSDMVLLRLQCLNLVGKIQAHKWSFMEDSDSLDSGWSEDAIRSLFTILLHDSSIRVRRAAMQIFMNLSAINVVHEKELLKVCLMKARDQDEKIRFMAFQTLRNSPVKTLADCLMEADWKALFERGFSEEKKETQVLVEALCLDFLTTELLPKSPSTRLQFLGLIGEESSPKQPLSFLYNNVESIFYKELEYLPTDE